MPSIYTPLCKLLDIEVPIIQAPIANAANPSLVAAVSNAGGLGTFAMANRTPEGIRELVEEAHRLTNRPFCANFLLRPNEPTEKRLQACLDAGVNVVQFFWEEPYQFVNQVHESGALVMYTVPSVEAASPRLTRASTLSSHKVGRQVATSGAWSQPWLRARRWSRLEVSPMVGGWRQRWRWERLV